MSAAASPPDGACVIELPTRLDAGWVERNAATLLAADAPAGHPLRLSVARIGHIDFLGEARLLGVLAHARRQRRPIDIVVGSDLQLDHDLPQRVVELFRDTLAGVVLAQLATSIRDASGVDHAAAIRRLQAEFAIEREGVFRFGREWAAPMIDIFGAPPPPWPLVGRRRARRGSAVDHSYAALFADHVGRLGLGPSSDIPMASLVEFSYEAFDNTRQHGADTLDGTPIEGVRFILMRVVNAMRERLAALADRVAYEPVTTYLSRLAAELPRKHEVHLVELTVADCGIGIPARIAGTEAIYAGPYADERECFMDAFALSRTTRVSHHGHGRGLHKMQRAARGVEGLMTLRTGRVDAHRSFLGGDSGWNDTECTQIPGTSVSMLFPWRPDRQLTLDIT